jgi:hypothetical protein
MSPATRGDGRIVVGGSPRADLLPPEVKWETKAKGQRRGLAAAFVAVVVLVGAGYALVAVVAQTSVDSLASENEKTANLLAEQGEYIEVRNVTNQVRTAEAAQVLGASTEIDWSEYLQLIEKTLPSGAEFNAVAMTSATPVLPIEAPTSPLESTRIAEVVITARIAKFADSQKWLNDMVELPGYVDAALTSVESESGKGYLVNVNLHVDDRALLNRFAPVEVTE